MENEYIRRDAAEQVICEACERPGCPILWGDDCDSIDLLNKIPAADVRPVVRGKWTWTDDMYETRQCSVCGYDTQDYIEYHFCPKCGADMREVKVDG